MNASTTHTTLRGTLLATALLATACGGGGGGGGGGGSSTTSAAKSVGAFTSYGTVLSIDPGNGEASVRAKGIAGYGGVNAIARDSSRNLIYAISSDRQVLLRIDGQGQVKEVGGVQQGPAWMDFDRATDELVGVRLGAKFQPSELVRVDPSTGAVTTVATISTSRFGPVAIDPAGNRLLALGMTSTAVITNDLYAIDLDTGAAQLLFSHPSFGTLEGITFDPVTGLLYGMDRSYPGVLITFDLFTQNALSIVIFDRPMQDVTLDQDSGRFFGLSKGGQVAKLKTDTQQGEVDVLVTLSRELTGLTFDPADNRFFAVDSLNGELVKVDPKNGKVTSIGILELASQTFPADVSSLAYDPTTGDLHGVDRGNAEVLAIDPKNGQCSSIGLTIGYKSQLAIDQTTGRIYGFDEGVDVVIEVDVQAKQKILIDNNTGLTKVEDLCFDPITGRLVALHETPGFGGVAMISSIALSSTNTSPMPEQNAPERLTGLGRDHRTGLYHAFGPDHPQYELTLDLASSNPADSNIESVDGAWGAFFRAALEVPSHGTTYAVDGDALYAWDASARRMDRLGSLPSGVGVADLLFDPATDWLGLRSGGSVTWISPGSPWLSKATHGTVSSSSMRLTCDPANGLVFGVEDGALYEIVQQNGGASSVKQLTSSAYPGFDADAVAYSPGRDAVFAVGTTQSSWFSKVLRFDTQTGDWTELSDLDVDVQALFTR